MRSERKRQTDKAWQKANRDLLLQKRRDYRAKDPEKWRAYSRAYYAANKEKARENERAWHAAHPGKRRETKIKQKYGLTLADFDAMLLAQGSRCAMCSEPFGCKTPHIDHDHATDVVRSLLCNTCNTGLGHIEKPGFVEAAMAYLATHKLKLKIA